VPIELEHSVLCSSTLNQARHILSYINIKIMGASYSFICCSLVGGALSHPDNETQVLVPLIEQRPDKMRIFGALAAVGFVFSIMFYASCHWSLDHCGFIGVSSTKDGLLLGFGVVGLIDSFLRRSDDQGPAGYGGGSGSYNPMMGGVTTQPAISMI
jgi:hypothetical protein